jgi:hypothetical protein
MFFRSLLTPTSYILTLQVVLLLISGVSGDPPAGHRHGGVTQAAATAIREDAPRKSSSASVEEGSRSNRNILKLGHLESSSYNPQPVKLRIAPSLDNFRHILASFTMAT